MKLCQNFMCERFSGVEDSCLGKECLDAEFCMSYKEMGFYDLTVDNTISAIRSDTTTTVRILTEEIDALKAQLHALTVAMEEFAQRRENL